MPAADVAAARPALLHPRLLLGLQARAGNAAVADLIARSYHPEQVEAPERSTAEAEAVEIGTSESSPPEAPTAVPRSGETDDELADLDSAAEPPAAAQTESTDERELVAQDAQSELAQARQPEEQPEPTGGPAEAGAPREGRPPPANPPVRGAETPAGA